MLAYVEKCGEGGRDRGMGPRSDSMAPKQQEVCVYDEKHSKHGNLEHPVGRTSRRAGVADGWAACAGRKEETLLIGASSHARRLHCTDLVCWLFACCVSKRVEKGTSVLSLDSCSRSRN